MFKDVTVVSKWGEVLQVFKHASSLSIEANANPNGIIVSGNPPIGGSFWDFSLKKFVPLGDIPSPHHTFDYTTKKWIDPRTLDEYKEQKWDEIKYERDRLEFGGFEFEGNIYDSDQVSQGRITGAALAGVDQVWTTADNSTITLTGPELLDLYQALQSHVASVHDRGRAARAAISAASTKEEVEEIHL